MEPSYPNTIYDPSMTFNQGGFSQDDNPMSQGALAAAERAFQQGGGTPLQTSDQVLGPGNGQPSWMTQFQQDPGYLAIQNENKQLNDQMQALPDDASRQAFANSPETQAKEKDWESRQQTIMGRYNPQVAAKMAYQTAHQDDPLPPGQALGPGSARMAGPDPRPRTGIGSFGNQPRPWGSLQFPNGQMPQYPGAPQQGSQPAYQPTGYQPSNVGQQFADAYTNESAARGGPIAPDDPQYINEVATRTGLDPSMIRQINQQSHDYSAQNNGQGPSASQITQWAQNPQDYDPTGQNRSFGARINQDYQSLLQKKGVSYLPSNDPDLLAAYQREGNLSPQQAAYMSNFGHDYYKGTQTGVNEGQFNDALGQLKSSGRIDPTQWRQASTFQYNQSLPNPGAAPLGTYQPNQPASPPPGQPQVPGGYPNANPYGQSGGYQNPYGQGGGYQGGYGQDHIGGYGSANLMNQGDYTQQPYQGGGQNYDQAYGGSYRQAPQTYTMYRQQNGSASETPGGQAGPGSYANSSSDPLSSYSGSGDNTGAYTAPSAANPNDGSGYGGGSQGQGQGQNQDQLQQYANALPDPNRMVGRNYMKMSAPDQDFLKSAYGYKGVYDGDVDQGVKNSLPGQKASYGGPGTVGG